MAFASGVARGWGSASTKVAAGPILDEVFTSWPGLRSSP